MEKYGSGLQVQRVSVIGHNNKGKCNDIFFVRQKQFIMHKIGSKHRKAA